MNLDVALANWTRERRGQTLFQMFIEENEAFESSQYDLFHGACLIAMHANPELDVNEQKNRVKALAEEVEKELPETERSVTRCARLRKSPRFYSTRGESRDGVSRNLEDYYATWKLVWDKVLDTLRISDF